MNFTQQDYKTTIEVLEAHKVDAGLFKSLHFNLVAKDNAQYELDKWTTFSLEDCPTFEVFEQWCEETLNEVVCEDTPHGEQGVYEEEGYFRWNNKEWLATYSPDWNRYDKQYYFIDDCGDNIKVEEIV